MLEKIIAFSVRQKWMIGILTLGLLILGIVEATKLPFDAVPDITDNQVQVITTSPALGAADVERLITMPLEMGIQNIPGIHQVRSFSRSGLSLVTVVFEPGVDVYWARQQIAERIQTAAADIPRGVGLPSMAPVTTGLGEIYQYVLKVKPGFESKYNAMELRTLQDWVVRRQLLGTEGIADVSSFGGLLKQYEIQVIPEKLSALGVSLQDVMTAVETNHQNAGGSYIERNHGALFIRTEGLTQNTDDLSNIWVRRPNVGESGVRIADIAQVQLGAATRFGALCYNQQGEVAGGVVLMLKGENSMKVISGVKEKIKTIQEQLPEGVEIEAFLDRSKMVNNALHTVEQNLSEGALIVLFVLVVFLGNWRAGWIVASVIPLALLFAIIFMNLFGVNGNLMSLGALDFGLIVDGAVIVVEAVLHHFNTHKVTDDKRNQVTVESSSRILNAAVFGQLIIFIVYLPILSLSGIEGKMFIPMAQTIIFALIGAFILSITYVPMMSALLLKGDIHYSKKRSERFIHRLQESYARTLEKAHKKGNWIIGAAVALFLFSLALLMNMGGEFIPKLEEGDFAVETRMLTGTHLNTTIEASQKAAGILLQDFPEVEKVVTKIGSGEIPTDPMPMEACDMMVILKDKKEWSSAGSFDELAAKMTESLAELPGVSVGFQFPVQMRFNELMTGARQDVVCKIYGENLDTLSHTAKALGAIIEKIEGAKDVYVESVTGLPEVVIQYNRQALTQYGITVEEINQTVEASFAGMKAGQMYEGEKRFDIKVTLPDHRGANLDDLKSLLIDSPQGNKVPLSALATIQVENGVNQIQREKAQRRIMVGFNVRERDIQSVVNELQQQVSKDLHIPNLYRIEYGGTFENLQTAKKRLSIAVPVSLFLILMMLYIAFGSMKQGLIIFSAIPLSAIGGIISLSLVGMPFSISAGIGFIALFGVAVLNGIVLMSEFNRLESLGDHSAWHIVQQGTRTRIRPVLMTATAASLGFLPMAISTGAGAEVQRPLAIVVIGGIITATALTLFVLPLLYERFFRQHSVSEPGQPRKISSGPSAQIILILLALSATQAHGQNTLDWDQYWQEAQQSDAYKQLVQQEQIPQLFVQQHTFDSPLSVNAEAGNLNSMAFDRRMGLVQNFQTPGTYKWQKQHDILVSQQQLLSIEQQKKSIRDQLQSSYYRYQVLAFQLKDMQPFKQQLEESKHAAKLLWEKGEINQSDYFTVIQTLDQWNRQYRQLEIQVQSLHQHMSLWIGNDQWQPLSILPNLVVPNNKGFWEVRWAENQKNLSQAELENIKRKRYPSLNLGINAMTIRGYQNVTGEDRYFDQRHWFPSATMSLQIPLPNGNRKRELEMAKIKVQNETLNWSWKVKANEMRYQQLSLQLQQYTELKNQLQQQLTTVYQPVSTQWFMLWKEGEISSVEWSFNVLQWYSIQNNYYDLLIQINDTFQQIQNLYNHD